jgi:hypothetical protein
MLDVHVVISTSNIRDEELGIAEPSTGVNEIAVGGGGGAWPHWGVRTL